MRRRLSLVVVLLSGFALLCAGAALVHPVRSQDAPTLTPAAPMEIHLRVPADDAMSLALAIHYANSAAPRPDALPVHIYLDGGTYAFAAVGTAQTPQFPLLSGHVILHGGGGDAGSGGNADPPQSDGKGDHAPCPY